MLMSVMTFSWLIRSQTFVFLTHKKNTNVFLRLKTQVLRGFHGNFSIAFMAGFEIFL